ncbi:MAG: multicopper oxidase domain-containing protein [Salinibacterium sp.]|nr:multicopper oxidase domain-containing protein [Salinibacterium sp.]
MSRKRWYLVMNGLIAGWLVAAAVIVAVHRFVPNGEWLMVHLLLLGAMSTAVLVWSQHFADTLLRHPAPGGRVFHGIRLGGHTVGVALVVAGMLTELWKLVLSGGIVVAAVAVTHAMTLVAQSRSALPSRFGPVVRFYIAAGLSLAIGVGIGVAMARGALPEGMHDQLYPAHLAFNLLGWLGLAVIGTVVLLWPTVLHTRVSDEVDATARRALWLCVVGLMTVGTASLLGLRPLFAIGLLVYLAGVGFVAADGVRLARNFPQQQTFASWSIAAAFGWFVFSTIAFGVTIVEAQSWKDAAAGLGWLVGPFAVGFAAQILLGALSYLLPVVLGGGPSTYRRTALELNRAALYRAAVVNLGIILYLLPVPSLVKVVDSFLVFAVLLVFLVLAFRAVVASRMPATAAEPPLVPTRRGGALAAAVATVVMALTLGIALDPVAAGLQLTKPAVSVTPTGHTTTVEMSMKDMRFTPDVVSVPAGDELVIRLTNNDDQVHDLVLENGASSKLMNPGQTVDVEVGVIGSDLDGWCSIAGHRQLGMVMSVTMIAAATPLAVPSHSGHQTALTEGPSAAGDIDLMKQPDASFEARDAALPPATSATVHEYTFTVRDEVHEVAPGVMQTLWTYGGTAPGPTLRGMVGDTFEITLVNDGTMGHSIDFHAGSLAPNEPMRTLQPGERLTYSFTATRSGIWLYHCSTMPMSLHIANGMFGAVIIDPPGLAAADREFVFVQSELYLGPQAGVADPTRIATQNPDLVVFNGYANQYRYRPIDVRVGERVRVWVLDAGPNRPSSFHIVGGQFDTVFSEGEYLLRNGGSTGTGGSQVLALQPAQGGFVELVFPEAGTYSFVTHVMSDSEKGAIGTFRVTP